MKSSDIASDIGVCEASKAWVLELREAWDQMRNAWKMLCFVVWQAVRKERDFSHEAWPWFYLTVFQELHNC